MSSLATGEQTGPRRRASCPTVTPAEWTPPLLQRLAPSSPDQGPQSSNPSGPYFCQTASAPDAVSETPPKDIPLLGLVPDRFGPAYDYLGKVKELADEIGPDVWDKCFEQHFVEGPMAFCIFSGKACWDFSSGDHTQEILQQTRIMRQQFPDTAQNNRIVIVVEAINKTGIQALGMALDVNPCFFAKHLGAINMEDEMARIHHGYRALDTRWEELGRKFESYVDSRRKSQHHMQNYDYHRVSSILDDETLHPYLKSKMQISDVKNRQKSWVFAGTGRVAPDDGLAGFWPRISCMRGFKNSFMVLVDAALPSDCNPHDPFITSNMIHLGSQRLPACLDKIASGSSQYRIFDHVWQALLEEEEPGLVFFPEHGCLGDTIHLLVSYMVLNAWDLNVKYIKERLEFFRHEAIGNPSLTTFRPLTVLRANIADLEKAVIQAKDGYNPLRLERVLEKLDEHDQAKVQRPEAMYDVLLQTVQAMSALLNNEIQLVIGSVTVQDSDIMKQQAERASLLTVLAVIYLPLTLVTGIFGMNVKQINDATPELWACAIGLVVVSGVTAVGFFGYRYWRKYYKQPRKGQGQDKAYKVA